MDKSKQFSDVEVSIPKTDYVFYPMIVIGRGQIMNYLKMALK